MSKRPRRSAAPPPPPPGPRIYTTRKEPPPDPIEGRAVASFTCPCGAQEEVREPAPVNVDCWLCKRPLSMRRWYPKHAPPASAGRPCTGTEFKRAAMERKAAREP